MYVAFISGNWLAEISCLKTYTKANQCGVTQLENER